MACAACDMELVRNDLTRRHGRRQIGVPGLHIVSPPVSVSHLSAAHKPVLIARSRALALLGLTAPVDTSLRGGL